MDDTRGVWGPVVLMGLALAGCSGTDGIPPSYIEAWDTFPFDGERTWSYNSSDDAVPYRLEVEIFGPGEPGLEDQNVYTLHYKQDCFREDPSCVTGDVLRIIKWSSDPVAGVLIHGYDTGDGMQELDPPLKLSADDVAVGDSWETVTGGSTWTSTYTGIEGCDVAMPVTWDTCLTFDVSTDAGEGYPIAGTWWSTKANGVARMEIATEVGQWRLAQLECVGADCGESWW
jgi:hypothetical protein